MKTFWLALVMAVLATFAAMAQENAALPGDTAAVRQDSVAMRNVELDELVVQESLVEHSASGDTYRVTEEMKRGVDGTLQMLGRLPGVDYNFVSDAITVRNDSKVLIQVNGNQMPDGYLKALSPDRIDKVEVTYVPSARYTAAGYRYVIDIKLKPEYRGHDIYVGNFMMVSAGDNNGDDVVANEQPQAMYMYSGDKVDFNAGYAFAEINWHYPLSYNKSYTGISDILTDEYTEKNPNDHNRNRTHAAFARLDWHIKPEQTLSFRANYENLDIGRTVENRIHATDADGREQISNEASVNDQKQDNITGAMMYRGKFGEKWDIYASIGYNRLDADAINSYTLLGGYLSKNLYRNTRDYLSGNFDLTYAINDNMWLNVGYIGTWNRYDSRLKADDRLLSQSIDGRHNAYVYYDYMASQKLMLHVGSGVEYISRTGLGGIDKGYWNWLPQVTLSYMPSQKVQLMADYKAQIEYPMQYQLSTAGYDIDSMMRFTGNPLLAPARTHSVTLSVSASKFYAQVQYSTTRDFMSEWYAPLGNDKFLSSFTNARYHSFKALAGYDWKISKYATWSNTVQISFDKIRLGGISRSFTNFGMVSQLDYWLNPWQMQFSAIYSRGMERTPGLQGWSDYGQDMWQVVAQKSFFKNRLVASLIYMPPLHLGIRTRQRSCVETPFYRSMQNLNLKTYDNMILLRLQFRFSTGKFRQNALRDNFNVTKEQQQKDRGLM